MVSHETRKLNIEFNRLEIERQILSHGDFSLGALIMLIHLDMPSILVSSHLQCN